MLGYCHQLSMGTIRGNPITNLESRNTSTKRFYNADVAVAEWQRLIQLALHRIEGREQAISSGFDKYLLRFIWLLAGFLKPASLPKIDEHTLSTRGY